jgi:hypothetical protein
MPVQAVSEPDEFAEYVKAKTLAAFGLHERDITAKVRAPWRVRLWRAIGLIEEEAREAFDAVIAVIR